MWSKGKVGQIDKAVVRRAVGVHGWGLQPLVDASDALSAAHAGGDHAVLQIAPFHLIEQLDGKLSAGTAQGMTESDGPTIDVDDLGVEPDLPDDRK